MLRIEFDLVDLEFERDYRQGECFLDLHDDYYHFKISYDAEVPNVPEDVSSGWVRQRRYTEIKMQRKYVGSASMYISVKSKAWAVTMDASGLADAVILYFKKKVDADGAFSKMWDWIHNKKENANVKTD